MTVSPELEIVTPLPSWFPDWLKEQFNREGPEKARELRKEYNGLIYWNRVLRPEDIKRIPEKVYHVSPHHEAIMLEGFKTAAELDGRTFGAAGFPEYVSFTTLENARTYQENLKMAVKVLNKQVNLKELKDWLREMSGDDKAFNFSYDSALSRYAYAHKIDRKTVEAMGSSHPEFQSSEFMWPVLESAHFGASPGAKLVFFTDKPISLTSKRGEDVKIVEATPSRELKFRHNFNIFPGEDMSPYYTYNIYEEEWRIWDSKKVNPITVLNKNPSTEIPEICEFSAEEIKPKEYFDRRSFRTLCPESPTRLCKDLPPELACATRIIIGCQKNKFVKGKCKVGTETHVIYHGTPKPVTSNPSQITPDLERIRRLHTEAIPDKPWKTIDMRTGKQLDKFWLPETLKKELIAEFRRPEGKKTGIAAIKYFNPTSAGTWWISEYDPDWDAFYGIAIIHVAEYGYTSRKELRDLKLRMGLWIERDYYFTPKPLKQIMEEEKEKGYR